MNFDALSKSLSLALPFLAQEKTIPVIHDGDGDGISAGLLTIHALRQLYPDKEIIAHTSANRYTGFFPDEVCDKINSSKTNVVMCLDFNPLNYKLWDHLKEKIDIEQKKVIIIDHHELKDGSKDNFILINPHASGHPFGSKYCTAKLCYDLWSEHTDISQYDWIAAFGVISDYTAQTWADFLRETAHKYDVKLDVKKSADWFTTPFAHLQKIVDCARAIDDEAVNELEKQLLNIASYQQSVEFKNPYPQVAVVVDQYLNNYKDIAAVDVDRQVVWLRIKKDYNVASWISSKISQDHPEMLYIVHQQQGDQIKISLRSQSGSFNCREVLNAATKDLKDGASGGHAQAAGSMIHQNQWQKFQDNINSYIQGETNHD